MCVCLLVQHLHRQQGKRVCFHMWRAWRPRAARPTSDRLALPRAPAELCGDGARAHAAHACSRLGGGEGRYCREAAIWEQGQERRGEAGSSYTAQSKSPWTGLRQKVSVGRNERTKQAVCAHTSSATTFPAMTNIHKTIPGQYGASDTQVRKIGAGVW